MFWKRKRKVMSKPEYLVYVRETLTEFVGALRTVLGDADNYVEMQVACPDTDEMFVLRVQRAGYLTPHQARVAAEEECERLREKARRIRKATLLEVAAACDFW